MSQSILYNKSVNSDLPVLEIKVFKRKLRIYIGISIVLFLILVVICIVLVLLWLGLINKKPVVILNRFVKVKCGLIEGNINNGIVEFLGIPYAYPPVDSRRFVHAQEILTEKGCREVYGDLSGVYLAKKYKPSCIQYNKLNNNLIGNEDCLYLNIYSPSSSKDQKLPVIFVISGVFFAYGSADTPGLNIIPEVVLATEAIHVTSNYRLGPMNSIINPETKETNHGLSDQLLALTWIRKNIAFFGGDPSNVIIYGIGSGSTIALALLNSNRAVNLFSKIWVSNPIIKIEDTLEEVFKNQEKYISDVKKLDDFQKSIKIEDIYRNWTWYNVERVLEDRWFTFPSREERKEINRLHFLLVDKDFITDSYLLKKTSLNRNIPLVIGNNANEVDIFPSPKSVRFWELSYFRDFVTMKMKKFSTFSNKTFFEVFDSIYAKDKSVPAEDGYTRMVTDIRITCPINSLLKKVMGYSTNQPIYRYILEDNHEYFDYFDLKYSNKLAAYAWDSILYLHGYKTHSDYGKYDEKEINMSKILNKAMRDFAWNDELNDMAISKDGNVIVNLIKNGKFFRECYFKANECKMWETHMNGTEQFLWSV